jgi:hypothetical protein
VAEVNEVQEDQQEAQESSTAEQIAEQLKAENQKLKASMTRQGWELGELRKKAKDLESRIPKEPVDFIAEPEKAVSQVLESHPLMQTLQAEHRRMAEAAFDSEVAKDFPDHKETGSDPEFIDWLQKSQVRARIVEEIAQTLNPGLAKDLLAEWAAKKAIAEGKMSSDFKAAKVTTGNNSSGKKVYTSTELQRLQRSDPEAYKQVALRAYAEGRVR